MTMDVFHPESLSVVLHMMALLNKLSCVTEIGLLLILSIMLRSDTDMSSSEPGTKTNIVTLGNSMVDSVGIIFYSRLLECLIYHWILP